MSNEFYVYVYSDPRKPGAYNYGDYSFKYQPFYIGKGKDDRWVYHYLEANGKISDKSLYNLYKTRKIKKIISESLEPIIFKVEENLIEREAFDLEIYLIWAIGRSDLKLGPLTNHSDGGEGSSGHIPSKESVLIRSQKNTGKKRSPEFCKRMSEFQKGENGFWYGKNLPKSAGEKISLLHKGKPKTKEHNEKVAAALRGKPSPMKGIPRTKETKEKLSKILSGKRNPMFGKPSWNKGLKKEQYHLYKNEDKNE